MKRAIVFLFILTVLFAMTACGEYQLASQTATKHPFPSTTQPATRPTTQPTTAPMGEKKLSDYLAEEAGEYYLVLPASGERIRILYAEYALGDLDRIDIGLLAAAETKLNHQMESYDVEYHFYVAAYNEEIWLCVEAIVDIDPPNGEGEGCGIDHAHIMLEEKITQ